MEWATHSKCKYEAWPASSGPVLIARLADALHVWALVCVCVCDMNSYMGVSVHVWLRVFWRFLTKW